MFFDYYITFFLQADKNEENDFDQENLTFT